MKNGSLHQTKFGGAIRHKIPKNTHALPEYQPRYDAFMLIIRSGPDDTPCNLRNHRGTPFAKKLIFRAKRTWKGSL
jgi:hypothetical protein